MGNIIFREESDILRLAPYIDMYINPISAVISYSGVTEVFIKYYKPKLQIHLDFYLNNPEIQIGHLIGYKEENKPNLLNVITKIFPHDKYSFKNTKEALIKIKDFLKDREDSHIALPLFSRNIKHKTYGEIVDLHKETFKNLSHTFHISEFPPIGDIHKRKYLLISGGSNKNITEDIFKESVKKSIKKLKLRNIHYVVHTCEENTVDEYITQGLIEDNITEYIPFYRNKNKFKENATFVNCERVVDACTHAILFKSDDLNVKSNMLKNALIKTKKPHLIINM